MLDVIVDHLGRVYPYALPPLIGFLVLISLSLLALIKGHGRASNILFSAVCFWGAFLDLDITLTLIIDDPELVLRINRVDHIIFVFSLPIYLHFIHSYLKIQERRWVVGLGYLLSLVFAFYTQNDLYLSGVHFYYFGYFAQAGPLFNFFIFIVLLTLAYFSYLTWKAQREEADSVRRNKIKYITLGFQGGWGLIVLDVLPMNGVEIYPPGNFSFVPMMFLAFAVLKHDLLDMGILIRKSLVYSLLTIFLTGLYALMLGAFHKLFRGMELFESFAFSFFFFLLVVFVFNPLRERLQVLIDHLFYKGKFDYQKTLREISQVMTSLLKLDEILGRIINTIMDAIGLRTGAVFLFEERAGGYVASVARGEAQEEVSSLFLPADSPLMRALGEKRQLFKRELDPPPLGFAEALKEFEALRASLLLPLRIKRGMIGFLSLGEKRSGDLYTEEDLELLQTLSDQSAISISNARAYDIIERLNADLEEKVRARTLELQRALEEKERTQEQLIHSESLAAIGQLVAGVAHELNNPLASVSSLIQSSVESFRERELAGPRGKELLEDMRFSLKELDRAKEIVRSLLNVSRQTPATVEPVQVNQVILSALRVLYNQYKKYDLKIIEEYGEDLPEVEGNNAQLGQVAINIIKNAIQAVGDGKGKIFLQTSFDPVRKRVSFVCQDTGRGIPHEALKDIFKPFFTTKEAGKGTGLGLYISHEIVKKHGGEIFVSSVQGEGTTVRVELPAAWGEAERQARGMMDRNF